MTSSPTWCRARHRSRPTRGRQPAALRPALRLDPGHRGKPDQPRTRPLRRRTRPRTAGSAATSGFRPKAWPTRTRSARRCWQPTRRSNVFAFGGTDICNPCFAGEGTNIPVRIDGGPAVPGMAGSVNPGPSEPAGLVRQSVSADGSHLLFGTTNSIRAGRPGQRTDDLRARPGDWAQPKSSRPTRLTARRSAVPTSRRWVVRQRHPRSCSAKKSATTAPAMRSTTSTCTRAGIGPSVDLTPGSGGVLFSGMTSDGSKVFFTTTDQLLGEDTDSSADVYEADVSARRRHAPPRLGQIDRRGEQRRFLHASGLARDAGTRRRATECAAPWPSRAAPALPPERHLLLRHARAARRRAKAKPTRRTCTSSGPAANPEFVATIDSSAVKAPGPAPLHPLATTKCTGDGHQGRSRWPSTRPPKTSTSPRRRRKQTDPLDRSPAARTTSRAGPGSEPMSSPGSASIPARRVRSRSTTAPAAPSRATST